MSSNLEQGKVVGYDFSDASSAFTNSGSSDYDLTTYQGASFDQDTLSLNIPNKDSGVAFANKVVVGTNEKFAVAFWFYNLRDRSQAFVNWMQFCANSSQASAGGNAAMGSNWYPLAVYHGDELGAWDGAFQSSGYTMTHLTHSGWHHIVASYDNGTLTFYVDGVQVGNPVSYDLGGANGGGRRIQLFGGYGNGYDYAAVEKMDDILIYDGRSLSASDVSELYALGRSEPGPTVLFNETFATDAGANATVSGVTFDGVANFSNPTDAITITGGNGVGSALHDDNGSYSISMWIKADVDESSGFVPILTDYDQNQDAFGFLLTVATNGDIKVETDGTLGVNQIMDTNTGVDVDGSAWNHIFISADNAADNFELYVNGVKKLDLQGLWIGGGFAADNAITLGNTTDPNFQHLVPLQGKMALVKIWNEASPSAQVSQYYGEGLTILNAYEANQSAQLIAHYTFDDLTNSTGNSDYDLVAYEGASVSGGALLLPNGSSGAYPTNEILIDQNGNDRFTVSLWFKDLVDRSTRDNGFLQFLADHPSSPAGSMSHSGVANYLIVVYENDELGVYEAAEVDPQTNSTFVSTGFQMLPANYTGWHHLVLLHDSGTTTFYVDGVQAGVPVSFTPTDVIQVFGSFGGIDLGGGNIFTPQNSPAAAFGNIRVYNDLLSASEISDLYTQEAPPTLETGLIAKFDLDSATETIGGHVGVLGHQAPATENPEFISDGTYQYLEICERGQGLTFSGTGLLEDLPHTSSWSFSAWVAIPEYVNINATRINYFGNDATSIFCKGTLAGGGNVISMALENGYPLLWHRKPEHGAFTQSATRIPLNTWTHLLVTIEGGPDNVTQGTIRWYVNGQAAGEGFHHPGGWWGVTNAESANQDIVIGGAPVTNQWPNMRFKGSIDDVRVWNRTLTLSDAVELYDGGRGPYQGHCPAPAPLVYDTLLGIHGTASTFPLPSPHGGWVAITADGKSYESTGGQDGTWAGPQGIAGSTATATSTRPVIEAGGFWFTTLHGTDFYGANNHIAYANALDTNGGKVFPSHNGWVQMADDGSAVDLPRALYTDGTHAYYTAVNDDSMTGHFANRLYKASVAVDSSSVPTWTKLNSNSADEMSNITVGLGPALAIKFGAAYGTKHVWVCKDQNDANEFGSAHIVVYDMANGEDVINFTTGVTLANVPSGSVNMGKPVYCAYSGAWYVPCKDAILKSTDGGLNWTSTAVTFVGSPQQEIDGIAASSSIDHTKIHSIGAGSNGTLIAVGEFLRIYSTPVGAETKGLILRSEDGITWSEVAEHTDPLYDVAVADQGVWAVVGRNNAIGFSDTDGVSWETVEYAEDQNDTPINSIFYGGLLPDAQGSSQPAPSSSVSIPSDCLLFLDASDTNSYDGYGTAWSDLSSEGNNATLVNSPTYNGSDKVFDFVGSNSQYATVGSGFSDFSSGATFFFVADLDAGDNWERLIDFSTGGRSSNHNVRNAGSPINVGRTDTGTGMTITRTNKKSLQI